MYMYRGLGGFPDGGLTGGADGLRKPGTLHARMRKKAQTMRKGVSNALYKQVLGSQRGTKGAFCNNWTTISINV